MTLIFEGQTKQVFSTEDEKNILIKFKDAYCDRAQDEGSFLLVKEMIASKINKHFFFLIDSVIQNHIISYNDDYSFLAKKLDIIPLKVIMRNFAAGTICKRRGYNNGEWFPYPLIEYFLKVKEDELTEVSEAQIVQSGMMNYEAVDKIIELSQLVNKILKDYLARYELVLIDIELEFGLDKSGNILLADEISPYTMRISKQNKSIYWDKDDFKKSCDAKLLDTYSELVNIVGA